MLFLMRLFILVASWKFLANGAKVIFVTLTYTGITVLLRVIQGASLLEFVIGTIYIFVVSFIFFFFLDKMKESWFAILLLVAGILIPFF